MAVASRAGAEAESARRAVVEADASDAEKAEMLMEIAMGLQQKPKSVADLMEAITLYQDGIELCPLQERLLKARIKARMATAQMMTPSDDTSLLEGARSSIEGALETLRDHGTPAELAEAEMNYGLILQNLAAENRARIQDSISAYQRALRTFEAKQYPAEFAILQSNLATAFLSIPFTDEKSKMREALAVQSFEEGLKAVSIIDHPNEYAMLQNNLGNALQYASSSHRIENGYRAIEAYDEALRVRTRSDMPIEYANTLSNKANCLANLPDEPNKSNSGNTDNIRTAIALYHEAMDVFRSFGEAHKVELVASAILELETALKGVQGSTN